MILDYLRENLEENADATFFLYRDTPYSYQDTYEQSWTLAKRLFARGFRPGDQIAVDLPNSADFVFLLLGGAMLNVSFFLLNHRLTPVKKTELLTGFDIRATIDEAALTELATVTPAHFGTEPLPDDSVFVRMFTSGSTGLPKAAELTYRNLAEAARASANHLLRPSEGVWQLVLPMYHVGGLQVVFRSLANHSSFLLYDKYDRAAVLGDLESFDVTHISVVDKILQDLIEEAPDLVRKYRVILLGGGPANVATLEAATGTNVYVSYGMTEACATVAASPLNEYEYGDNAGGMKLLPGYQVRILDEGEGDVGEIALTGPAVFGGYSARAGDNTGTPDDVFTPDGYFRTGDRGRFRDGLLYVKERLSDLFISGGENIYPREIEREILAIEGVEEAAVIGAANPEWGRRPIAFVSGQGVSSASITEQLTDALTKFQRPDEVFVLGDLPHMGIGKIDKQALADLYEHRIQVESVNLYRISQPFITPFSNSQTELAQRESVIVEVVDHAGRKGYGESVAFSTPWYTPETIDSTMEALTEHLIPTVLGRTYLNPSEVFPSFSSLPDNLMAKGALEPACWDLYGRITGVPLPELLADWLREAGAHGDLLQPHALAGVSLGVLPIAETLEQVEHYVDKGYTRVKLKIKPGDDVERLTAVRQAHPDLMLMADANQSYSVADIEVFRQLDALQLVCIEEPIDGSIAQIAEFQRLITTPISIDESVITEDDLAEVLHHPELTNINLKIGKAGGVLPSLQLYRAAQERGLDLWLGGMLETGVSKYLHGEFERLARFTIPGDISESRRYFERDIVVPEVTVHDGNIVLPHGPGLGFELDHDRINDVLIEKIEVARNGH